MGPQRVVFLKINPGEKRGELLLLHIIKGKNPFTKKEGRELREIVVPFERQGRGGGGTGFFI